MAKYIVETFYTCSFKIVHKLDELNEKKLSELENRKDGEVQVIDVKLNSRKTKTVGKKSKSSPDSETQMKQKIAAQNKKQEIKNKENREEWAEIDKLAGKLKTGAKIIGGVIGTTIVAGEVKHKLKKKDEE